MKAAQHAKQNNGLRSRGKEDSGKIKSQKPCECTNQNSPPKKILCNCSHYEYKVVS